MTLVPWSASNRRCLTVAVVATIVPQLIMYATSRLVLSTEVVLEAALAIICLPVFATAHRSSGASS